jgi:hypothetical protein
VAAVELMPQQEMLVVLVAAVVVLLLLLVVLQIKVALAELVMATLVVPQTQQPQVAAAVRVLRQPPLLELSAVLVALEQVCFLLGVALLEQVRMSAELIILLAVELEMELAVAQRLVMVVPLLMFLVHLILVLVLAEITQEQQAVQVLLLFVTWQRKEK